MSSSGSSKKRSRLGWVPVILLITAVLAVIFYVSAGPNVSHPDTSAYGDPAANVERIAALEERPAVNIAAILEPPTEAETEPEISAMDEATLREVLLSHYGDYDYNAEHYRRWFSDAAIVGDSLAYAIYGFEWVNEVNVQAEVGINFYTCEDVIVNTEWLQPNTIFLTFSTNNLANYAANVDQFIIDYTEIINRLQSSVQGADIYVQAILQCSADFLEEYWYFEYLNEYNQRIEQMCAELGVHYYDMNWIPDAHPDIFSEDGYHPTWPFYPLWMTYMAEIAGLTDIALN